MYNYIGFQYNCIYCLSPPESAKHSGVILYRKLSCRLNVGKTSAKLVTSMFKVIVKPILTYKILVREKTLDKKTYLTFLSKLQKNGGYNSNYSSKYNPFRRSQYLTLLRAS